jgi:hypothetical protein
MVETNNTRTLFRIEPVRIEKSIPSACIMITELPQLSTPTKCQEKTMIKLLNQIERLSWDNH